MVESTITYRRLLTIDKDMRESVLLLGPRGTGKTYWLKQHFPAAVYFDLLDSETYTEFLGNPSLLAARIPKGYKGWVIIDEIQKIPTLLNEVHRLIEHNGYRFVLTGSSARALRRKGVNLLAGRALTYYMHPLTATELDTQFNLDYSLQYGLLPSVYVSDRPEYYLTSYVQTYLKEEVLQEALTRNLALFTKFLVTASFSQGETLNYSEIAREIGSNRQTVANFFDILDDLLIAVRLPVFTRCAKRKMVSQVKFYFFDTGVFRVLRPRGPLDSDEEQAGAALETLFLQHVRALNDYLHLGYTLYYWRTREQQEVDFILYGEEGLHAFEIKRKSKLATKDIKGLKTFQKDYPMATCTLLYGGTREYLDNNIRIIPFIKGLTQLSRLIYSDSR